MMAEESGARDSVVREGFYAGRIVKLRRGSRSGVVEALGSGRHIPFEWPLVRILGAQRLEELVVGMEVGFDVSWTSRGLRVSAIKVFSPSQGGQAAGAPIPESAAVEKGGALSEASGEKFREDPSE